MNCCDIERQRIVNDYNRHIDSAVRARNYMNEVIEQCRQQAPPPVDGVMPLQPVPPLSGPEIGHYCFDFAQQVSFTALTSLPAAGRPVLDSKSEMSMFEVR